jgi:hypothetical protein
MNANVYTDKVLDELLDNEYRAGRISEDLYRQISGRSAPGIEPRPDQ